MEISKEDLKIVIKNIENWGPKVDGWFVDEGQMRALFMAELKKYLANKYFRQTELLFEQSYDLWPYEDKDGKKKIKGGKTDILIKINGSEQKIPIELKYKPGKDSSPEFYDQKIIFKKTNPSDLTRKACYEDIAKLECYLAKYNQKTGFFIFVSNLHDIWTVVKKGTAAESLTFIDGDYINNNGEFKEKKKKKVTKYIINGHYRIEWFTFGKCGFKCLIIQVFPGNGKKSIQEYPLKKDISNK